MAPRGNEVIPNAHFKKHWERYVKNWFNQAGKKKRRRQKRLAKAAKVSPRPVKALRPLVRCPTARYNTKVRLGRGFTLEELKGADISRKLAPKIGICVDHRRRNKSLESLQANIQRLKEYHSKLVLFPQKQNKPRRGDSDLETCKMATQLKGDLLPVKQPVTHYSARQVTEEERKYSVFQTMRIARIDAKLIGVREKRAKQKAEEASKLKKK